MKEQYIAHIWKYRLYQYEHLTTVKNIPLEVIHPGTLNHDSGPDFFNAKIRIGDTLWVGNVEIHQKSSDWEKHGHGKDDAYENVILHLVYEYDKNIYRQDQSLIPTLELKNKITKKIEQNFFYLFNTRSWIPCEKRIGEVDGFMKSSWLDRVLVERLELKSEQILKQLKASNYDWEEVFYKSVMQSFGLRVNSESFGLLADQLPLSVIGKHRHELFQLESLLFGVAGFLENAPEDDYQRELKKEFAFLKQKFDLLSMPKNYWKFSTMRPSNFPSIRLAQVAQLFYKESKLFGAVLNCKNDFEYKELFDLEVSTYWETHYQFGKERQKRQKRFGKNALQVLLINSVVPFLFIYGKEMGNQQIENRALTLLEELPVEKNTIINAWKELNMPAKSAFQSQALLHLKKHYCDKKKCLDCVLGHQLLKG